MEITSDVSTTTPKEKKINIDPPDLLEISLEEDRKFEYLKEKHMQKENPYPIPQAVMDMFIREDEKLRDPHFFLENAYAALRRKVDSKEKMEERLAEIKAEVESKGQTGVTTKPSLSDIKHSSDRTCLTLPPYDKDLLMSTGESDNGHYSTMPMIPFDEDISKNKEANEWVLNHLPLTGEQKDVIIVDLSKDKIGQNMKEMREELLKKGGLRKVVVKKEEECRQSVKDKSKKKKLIIFRRS